VEIEAATSATSLPRLRLDVQNPRRHREDGRVFGLDDWRVAAAGVALATLSLLSPGVHGHWKESQ
jgi:hypothetical protein